MRHAQNVARTIIAWRLGGAAIFFGLAAWFLYNGAIHWPEKNRQRAEESLAILQPFASELAPDYDRLPGEPDKSMFDEFVEARPLSAEWVHRILGEPQITTEVQHGFDPVTTEYYVSQWGYGTVTYRSIEPVISESPWRPWYSTKSDIRLQYVLAGLACILALCFLGSLRRLLRSSSGQSQSTPDCT